MVTVTRPPPRPVAKRRSPSPATPRVRKAGFRPFLVAASARVRSLRAGTPLGQFYALSAFIIVMCLCTMAGVWLAREANHRGSVALAAYSYCAEPRPISHVMACKDFACLASVNEDNARYVRICHPEALRG